MINIYIVKFYSNSWLRGTYPRTLCDPIHLNYFGKEALFKLFDEFGFRDSTTVIQAYLKYLNIIFLAKDSIKERNIVVSKM